jgi:hypothetical protein
MEMLAAKRKSRYFAAVLDKFSIRSQMCSYIVMTLIGPLFDKHLEKLPGNK